MGKGKKETTIINYNYYNDPVQIENLKKYHATLNLHKEFLKLKEDFYDNIVSQIISGKKTSTICMWNRMCEIMDAYEKELKGE